MFENNKSYGTGWYFAINCFAYIPIACDYAMRLIMQEKISQAVLTFTALVVCVLMFVMARNTKTALKYFGTESDSYAMAKKNLGAFPATAAAAGAIADYVLTTVIMAIYFAYIFESFFASLDIKNTVGVSICLLVAAALMNYGKIKIPALIIRIFTLLFGVYFVSVIFALVSKILTGGAGVHFVFDVTSHPVKSDPLLGLFVIIKLFSFLSVGIIGFDPMRYRKAYENSSFENVRGIYRVCLCVIFMMCSVLFLTQNFSITPDYYRNSFFQLANLGTEKSIMGVISQYFTLGIMFLCTYYTFAALPEFAQELAKDGFFPTMFKNNRDEIMFAFAVFITLIIFCAVIILAKGNLALLLGIYAIGAFLSLGIGQFALAKSAEKTKDKIFAYAGAFSCFVLMSAFAAARIKQGSVYMLLLVVIFAFAMMGVRAYYEKVNQNLTLDRNRSEKVTNTRNSSVVILTDFDRGVIPAVRYAKAIASDCRAIFVAGTDTDRQALFGDWEYFFPDVPLIVLDNSKNNNVIKPILNYIRYSTQAVSVGIMTVVIPEYIPKSPFYMVFHRNYAFLLRLILGFKKGIITASVPYWTEDEK